jgi:hypothetical protein
MKKRYKSLGEVYLAESFLKKLPPLPGQGVLGEAKIKITFNDGRVKELETSDYTAGKLLGVEAKVTTGLNEEAKKWFAAGGWREEAQGIGVPMLVNIIERNLKTDNTGIVREVIEDINTILGIKKTLSNFKANLKEPRFSVNGFIKSFPVKLKQLGNVNLIRDIERNLIFSESGVTVGPGEVLATLYSEMVNPNKGDLSFPDGKVVELKGSTKEDSGGRPGKKSVVDAATRALVTLRAEYSKLRGVMDAKLATELVEILKPYRSVLNSMMGDVKLNQKRFANQKRFVDVANMIFSDNMNMGKILANIPDLDAFAKAGDTLTGSTVGTKIAEELSVYKDNREGKEIKTFRNYFNAEKNPNILAEKLASFSVRPERIDKVYLEKYLVKLGNDFNSNYAAKIVSAIQIADYQAEEGFSYIVFFNSMSDQQVVVGEFTQDYMTNLNISINSSLRFKSVNPGTGGTSGRGGFNIIV